MRQSQNKRAKTPPKVDVLPGIFSMTSYDCMCKNYCFLVCSVVFALLFPKHYKIGILVDFKFCGQHFKVNNLATSMSITWPHFSPKCLGERWPSY